MSRRVWVLLAHDPQTGAATAVAGVAGVEEDGPEASYVSWVPYSVAADRWRERVPATTVALADAVGEWGEYADGISWDLVELEAPGSPTCVVMSRPSSTSSWPPPAT